MRIPDAHRKKKQIDVFAKNPSEFTIPWLQKLAEGLKTGRMKTDRITVSDDMVPGLRAIVRDTGGISFHVQDTIGKVSTLPQDRRGTRTPRQKRSPLKEGSL